jgi:tetraacyldisaccharide 4'-kinase
MHIFRWSSLLLWPLAQIYGAAVRTRNWLYDHGFLPVEAAPCRVVSVGNLTVGGSGKTPAIVFLAKRFQTGGAKVVVLSRGYRRQSRGLVVVSDGSHILCSPQEAGDEPYLLARRLNGVPVLVDNDRRRAARDACDRFAAEVILLDDGFQHRKLARDEDHVLVSAHTGFGNGRLLPAGPLREPLSSLARASQVWITKVPASGYPTDLVAQIRKFTEAPVRFARHQPVGFRSLQEGKDISLAALDKRKVFCFAGIAEPETFFAMVADSGAEIVGKLAFHDHVTYSGKRMAKVFKRALEKGAEALVTTEKDAVKLAGKIDSVLPVFCLVIDFEPVSFKAVC